MMGWRIDLFERAFFFSRFASWMLFRSNILHGLWISKRVGTHYAYLLYYSYNFSSDGILEAARELKIPIMAYSPLGRGFLTVYKSLSLVHIAEEKS